METGLNAEYSAQAGFQSKRVSGCGHGSRLLSTSLRVEHSGMEETNLSLHACPLSLLMNALGLMETPNSSPLPPGCLFVTSQSEGTQVKVKVQP